MSKTIRTEGMGRRGPLPVKRSRIADWVRRTIALGEFKPGDRLPDRTWFRAKFDANPNSVQSAFALLKEDGLVRSVSGHGTCVADPLPFAGRYLLLLKGNRADGGSRFFSSALETAARQIARSRDLVFEFEHLIEAEGDSVEYAEMLERVRRQRYAGVFVQDASCNRGVDTVTNVDNVPMTIFAPRSVFAQGSQVVPLGGFRDTSERILRCHLKELRDRGCRRIAVFYPRGVESTRVDHILPYVGASGLELVPEGFHTADLCMWDARQFTRLVRLFLDSSAGQRADGVVLDDENFLPPFIEACRDVLGRNAAKRYVVSAHGNFPQLPEVDFPMQFHGVDCTAMLESFVAFADACRRADRKPPLPQAVVR